MRRATGAAGKTLAWRRTPHKVLFVMPQRTPLSNESWVVHAGGDVVEKHAKAGNDKGVRGVEALAVSMIARHQSQPDLMPGVNFLDRYIEDCMALATPPSKVVSKPVRH